MRSREGPPLASRSARPLEQFQPFRAQAVFEGGLTRLRCRPAAPNYLQSRRRPDRGQSQTRSARCGSPAAATPHPRTASAEDDIRRERHQFGHIGCEGARHRPPTGSRSAHCGRWVQPCLLQALQKCPVACLCHRIVGSLQIEHADATHPLALLRPRRDRPRCRRTADERDELAACHSITSSAATVQRQRDNEAERPGGLWMMEVGRFHRLHDRDSRQLAALSTRPT